MKTSAVLVLASGYLQASHAAVHFSFAKQKVGAHETATGSARRSSDPINAGLSYQDATYVVNVTVGTPGQLVSLQLSPSASNTFVIDARSDWCASSDYYYDYDDLDDSDTAGSEFCRWGTFAPGNSTSYKSLVTTSADGNGLEYGFSEDYNDGSYVYGEYMNDVLTIDGGMVVSNLTMGLVNETSSLTDSYMGVLGIGYNDSSYDNLPNRLQQDGLINSTAYSMWVDDETASSGNLLFGAIDTSKFEGNLTRLMSEYSYYMMMVQVVGINGSTSKSDGPIAITSSSDEESASGSGYSSSETDGDGPLFTALFSPPDTVSNLPTDIASQIWQMAGAYYDYDRGVALVSCSAADDATNFTIQLGGQGARGSVISAFMSDLVIPAEEFNISSYYDTGIDNMCLFGIQNSSSMGYYSSGSTYNLGSTLLRRTYSVFDLVNNEVAVAPVRFGATSASNIVPFESYGASVPSSTVLCIYSDCYADSGSGTGSDGGLGDETGGTGRLGTGVLSVGALVGMSAGVALGCLALGLAGFLIWRHRRNRSPASTKEMMSVSSAEAGGGASVMPSATAAGAVAPETEEAPQTPAVGTEKAPEVREALPGSSIGGPHATPGATKLGSTHYVDNGKPSSSRNA